MKFYRAQSDIRIIFSFLMGFGAISLFIAFSVGLPDHWLGWPALISGAVLVFLSPCILAGWYIFLGVLEWKQGRFSSGRLSSPLVRANVGLGAAAIVVILQIGAAYIEMVSFKQAAPKIDQRLLELASDKAEVDLSNENIRKAHELYAEAKFLKSGSVHVVTSVDGEKVTFLPDLQALIMRESFQARRIRSALIGTTLLIGAGLNILVVVFCLISALRWA